MRDAARIHMLLPNLRGGGAERVMLTLARAMNRTLFQPTIVVVDGSSAAFRADIPSDVELVDLECTRVRRSLSAIVRCVRARRPDIVLSAAGHLNVAVALVKPLLPRKTRIFAREAGVVADTFATQGSAWLWTLAYRNLYGRFDGVFCQSEQMRNELIADFGIDPRLTTVVYNPVDTARARGMATAVVEDAIANEWLSGAGTIRLVAAGRLAPEKGFDLLVDAMAHLDDPRYRLLILGDGPMRESLAARIRARGLDAQVRLAGFVSNPFALFARADAFVLSSYTEAFPNVVLEALACGTRVICTPARGGLSELIAGKTRCHVAGSTTAESLADAIRHCDFSPGSLAPPPALDVHEPRVVAAAYERVLLHSLGRARDAE